MEMTATYVLVIEGVCTQKHKALSSALRAAEKSKGLTLAHVNIGISSRRDAYEYDGVVGLSAFTDSMKHPSLLVLVFEKADGGITHGRVMWRKYSPECIREVHLKQRQT
jgi:hypothetical protein